MLVIFSVIIAVAHAVLDEPCPAAGFVTYENRRVLRRNQFLVFRRVDGIEDCYRECISRSKCGFFEITLTGSCIMFTPEFSESNLTPSFVFKVGVPCVIDNLTEEPSETPSEPPTEAPSEVPTEAPSEAPTEAPSEAPTEAPSEAPTEAPSEAPTEAPSEVPTDVPSDPPTEAPSETPTEAPTGVATLAPTGPTAAPNDCPTEGYFRYPTSSIGRPALISAFFHLSGQDIDVDEFCNAACSSRSDCGFFQVDTATNTCIISRGAFDESLLANSRNFFVGVPCCPVQGYVIYSGNTIRNPDLVLAIVGLAQEEGGDNCNAECSLRRECGYFHVADNNCVMFRGPFHQSLLSSDAAVFVGVPCVIENPTEDPSETPTESPTEASTGTPTGAPTLAPTRPTAGPNDCPAEGFFRYPRSFIGMTELVFAFYFLNEQGVHVDDFCNAACSSHSDCGFFQISASLNACRIFTGAFDESLLSSGSSEVVGAPCCPVQGYVIYSGNAIRSPDLLLDIVGLGQEEGGDNCNAECSLRRECGYFHVVDHNCVMFRGPFHQGLLSSDAAVFVGVPCSN